MCAPQSARLVCITLRSGAQYPSGYLPVGSRPPAESPPPPPPPPPRSIARPLRHPPVDGVQRLVQLVAVFRPRLRFRPPPQRPRFGARLADDVENGLGELRQPGDRRRRRRRWRRRRRRWRPDGGRVDADSAAVLDRVVRVAVARRRHPPVGAQLGDAPSAQPVGRGAPHVVGGVEDDGSVAHPRRQPVEGATAVPRVAGELDDA